MKSKINILKDKFTKIVTNQNTKHTITKCAPTKYEDITMIADLLKENKSVILDLSKMPENKWHRCLDFIAGVLYTVNGTMERTNSNVANKTYILTPRKVVIDEEYRQTIMNLDLKKM